MSDNQYYSSDQDTSGRGHAAVFAFVAVAFMAATFWYIMSSGSSSPPENAADKRREQRQKVLKGLGVDATFTSTNAELGSWTLKATGCLSGFERGFQGVVFTFAARWSSRSRSSRSRGPGALRSFSSSCALLLASRRGHPRLSGKAALALSVVEVEW